MLKCVVFAQGHTSGGEVKERFAAATEATSLQQQDVTKITVLVDAIYSHS